MNSFSKFIYTIGGYDYKIVEQINPVTTHFSLKYFVAGFSLLIILLTAGYGGWHFTATLIDQNKSNYDLLHIISTAIFALFIFCIDYLILNAGKNKLILIARVVLSLGLGSLIAILTTLSFFQDDLETEIISQKNLRINPIDKSYDLKITEQTNEIKDLETRITTLRDSAVAERQGRTKSGKAGPGGNWEEIHKNIGLDSISLSEKKLALPIEKDKIEKERTREKNKVEKEFNSNDFIAQIKSLMRLMKDKIVSFYTFVFLISLIICDLIPLLAKISKDYSTDYDPYNEHIASLKNRIKIQTKEIMIDFDDIELVKKNNDKNLAKFNEDALMRINTLYALEKYNELLIYFKEKGIAENEIQKILENFQEKINKQS